MPLSWPKAAIRFNSAVVKNSTLSPTGLVGGLSLISRRGTWVEVRCGNRRHSCAFLSNDGED